MIYDCEEELQVTEQSMELNRHGTALYPIACYREDMHAAPVPWHWHEDWEFVLVTEGEVAVTAGGSTFLLGPGQGIFLGSGVLHALRAQRHGLIRSAVFHPRLIGSMESIFWQKYCQPLLRDDPCRSQVLDGSAPWHAQALSAFEQAWLAEEAEEPGYELLVREHLSRLCFLLGHNRQAGPTEPTAREQRSGQRVKSMLQFIHSHYSEPLNTALIADSASISESECLRCFHQIIGVTPIRYLRQYRVQQAAELLRSGRKKVTEVGAACGFDDPAYFARVFREEKGCSPLEYRRRNRA